MYIEIPALPAVHTGSRRRVAWAVVQTAQFLFEIIRTHWSTDIEIEWHGKDTRRHRPMPTLKFPGHEAVEVHDPHGGGGSERAQYTTGDDEQNAPA